MALNPRTSPRLADRDSSRNFSALRAIIPFVRPYRLQVAGAMVALVVASGTVLALGSGLRMLVDQGFADGNASLLDQALFVLFAVTLLMAGASYARFFLVSWIGERVVADIRSAVYAHIIRLDPGFFEVTRTGEVLSRLTTDTTLLQVVIGSSVSIALRNILMFVGGLTMLAITSPKLTALVLLVVPLVVVPIIGYGRRVRRLSREAQDRIADVSAFSEESLNALRTVQAYTHEKIESDKFDGFVEGAFKTAISRISARALLTAIVIVMVFGAVGTILWIGGHDVLDGTISAGDLSAFVFYAIVVAGSVGAISEVIGDLQRAAGAAERLMGLLETEPAIAAPANPVQMPQKHLGHVSFENVTFHYPARPDRSALTGFSLQVKPGETVALVGPSGAGKTTVFQLLLRFYDPANGVIKVDDVDIRTADPIAVRERIGLVAQDPVIFAANAWENIRYGRPDASDEDVRAAADAAHATEFLDRLPDGFDSFLGERGVRLSGGQRQRIAIARAILRNPSVLLLDEATSALDAESEQVVQKALETIMATRTTLVIAHRLATVLHADRIAVIDDGKLIAIGTHQELMESNPLYGRLARLQFEQDAA
ncbi:ATP-binding cassette subfamily B protein [Thalassospira sp. MBR-102]|uniref:ABC transporter n=2 Tax=Thalassospira xiamenensis TaxID=220697 RepID=A0ABR5XWI1_9PROT|nr:MULTISPECIES: ABC transporter transmembrane domain-containing protein [Thalassospira]MBL4841221.1 ATP-binding cassette domain-containing protein [Thalassospira sp.]MBR9781900.1 ATP-binding cassette domain-containing protein [Rhodospirillales bacterium]KZC96981.1 ABC transporter [Thalassospira xiamenensis]KZD09767.1 ABC transporter [Thalassospira xiamenensis]MBR9818707.1 ATP-binding cassette domain-containing protein [Rhodospirillales bacterium]